MPGVSRITPCLWFDHQAEEAAEFYTSIFKNSRITNVSRYGEAGQDIHGQAVGRVMTVAFELDGQPFTALNGGPLFAFSEAISFAIDCENQAEVDYFWERLTQGGDENAQQCGWLKDQFGVSWQVLPNGLGDLLGDPTSANSQRAMEAMLKMKKIDIEELRRVYAG